MILLLHSPLVTKETWHPLSTAFNNAGVAFSVAEFDNDVEEDRTFHQHHLDQANACMPGQGDKLIIVAHSGAGPIAALMDPELIDGYVFLDAMLPLVEGSRFDLFDDPAGAASWRKTAQDNNKRIPKEMLARFGEQIVDGAERDRFVGALKDVPIVLYEEDIPVHPRWPSHKPGLYLKWSEAYAQDAARARSIGFTVESQHASHFEMVNSPQKVMQRLVEFAASVEAGANER